MAAGQDGTCYTMNEWDEGHNERGEYKDGDVIVHNTASGKAIDNQQVNVGGCTWRIDGKNVTSSCGTISDCVKPTALGVDIPNSRLMVADDGAGEHIIKFYDLSGGPKLVRTLGQKGGIRAGTPGEVQPDKFWGITGCGTDTEGNIYVALSQHGSIIRSFTPDGKTLRWEVLGLFFSDVCDFEPGTEGRVIWGPQEYFEIDYTKKSGDHAEGSFWKFKRYTLDVDKYPTDPRHNGSLNDTGAVWARTIKGRTFLYMMNMKATMQLQTYKFNFETDGYIAIPSKKLNIGRPGFAIAENGDIYYPGGGLSVMQCQGYDDAGDLVYGAGKVVSSALSPVTNFQDVDLVPGENAVIVSGGSPQNPMTGCCEAGPNIVCFDGLSSGQLTRRWQIIVPFRNADDGSVGEVDKLLPHGTACAGGYIFVGYQNRDGDYQMRDGESGVIRVYDIKTGEFVGRMIPQGPGGMQGSWLDIINTPLRAIARSGGEILVMREENWKNKNIIFRWCPGDTCGEPVFSAAGSRNRLWPGLADFGVHPVAGRNGLPANAVFTFQGVRIDYESCRERMPCSQIFITRPANNRKAVGKCWERGRPHVRHPRHQLPFCICVNRAECFRGNGKNIGRFGKGSVVRSPNRSGTPDRGVCQLWNPYIRSSGRAGARQ
jgi:hypothetical protein